MNIFVKRLALGGTGPRVGVKDTIDIAGHPTVAGCRALADAPPADSNAAVVDLLLAAGCQIVGKTNLHELAFGATGINDWSGTPINPRFPDHVPGGSSSGSAAAVAAGAVDFALGTDTGGSIRVPAACCGIFGLKPTFGRVSRVGVAPARSSLDCVGPLAASMDSLIAAMRIIDPTFALETVGAPVLGLVAVQAEAQIVAAVERTVCATGLSAPRVLLAGMDDACVAGLSVINAETWKAFGALLDTRLVGEDVALRLKAASKTSAQELAAAEVVRTRFQADVDAALDHCDVLILPTLPLTPPRLVAARTHASAVHLTVFVRPFNLSGHPALSVPIEIPHGSAGLQIVGRRGADGLVCAVAASLAASLAEQQT